MFTKIKINKLFLDNYYIDVLNKDSRFLLKCIFYYLFNTEQQVNFQLGFFLYGKIRYPKLNINCQIRKIKANCIDGFILKT